MAQASGPTVRASRSALRAGATRVPGDRENIHDHPSLPGEAGRIAGDVIFGLVVFATVVNVIVWAVARFLLRKDPGNPKRLPLH